MRVLPDHCDAVVRRGTWEEPRIFAEIQAAGDVADDEMAHVFNLGLGMLAVVPADAAEHAVDIVRAAGHDAWVVGEIVDGHRRVRSWFKKCGRSGPTGVLRGLCDVMRLPS